MPCEPFKSVCLLCPYQTNFVSSPSTALVSKQRCGNSPLPEFLCSVLFCVRRRFFYNTLFKRSLRATTMYCPQPTQLETKKKITLAQRDPAGDKERTKETEVEREVN